MVKKAEYDKIDAESAPQISPEIRKRLKKRKRFKKIFVGTAIPKD